MKRLLVLAASACLLGAAAPPATYNAFGVAVLQRLAARSQNGNVFISPVSLGVALAMAADGAAGNTRAALLHGLRVNGENLAAVNSALINSLMSNGDAAVAIANAVWLRQDLPPQPAYVALLRNDYHAQARAMRFGDPSAAAAINAWTRQHTFGLIDHVVDSTDPYDFAYLTNALAFSGNWTAPFARRDTRPHSFTDANGFKHNVQMMFKEGRFAIADEPAFRALRLPYGKGGYAAYILLPAKGSAAALVRDLTASTFDRVARSAGSEMLNVGVPRFTARYDASLGDVLKALGMGIAFGVDANFSVMTGPARRVYIAKVLHKTYLRVDEAGTVAAAATAVEMALHIILAPARATPFIVDRPFVFALRDERTGTLLFVGVINTIPPG